MRISAFLAGMAFSLSVSVAAAGPERQGYVADRVGPDLIITQDNSRVALYGARLVHKEEDAALHQKALRYMDELLNPPSFILDRSAYNKGSVARNRYGDLHGKIMLLDGRWLQEELIAKGYAFWSGEPGYPPDLRRRLVEAERAASIEKLGIWRHFRIVNANQSEQRYWNGQFIIAKGVVREVYRGASATYINFGDDWRSDFTAAIPSRSRKKFVQGDWTIASLKNRSITVRGFVRFYNGPYLELDFPEQLEIDNMYGGG